MAEFNLHCTTLCYNVVLRIVFAIEINYYFHVLPLLCPPWEGQAVGRTEGVLANYANREHPPLSPLNRGEAL